MKRMYLKRVLAAALAFSLASSSVTANEFVSSADAYYEEQDIASGQDLSSQELLPNEGFGNEGFGSTDAVNDPVTEIPDEEMSRIGEPEDTVSFFSGSEEESFEEALTLPGQETEEGFEGIEEADRSALSDPQESEADAEDMTDRFSSSIETADAADPAPEAFEVGNAGETEFVIDDTGKLTRYNGTGAEAVLPEEVTVIGTGAFENCVNVRTIIIPDTLAGIEWNAFNGCENLAEISLPDHVEIDGGAFDGCPVIVHCRYDSDTAHAVSRAWHEFYEEGDTCFGLRYVEIYDENEGASHEELSLDSYAGTEAVVSLPGYIRRLNDSVFQGNESLEKVTVANGTIYIGNCAFEGCVNLTEAVLPDTLEAMGYRAFYECKKLKKLDLSGSLLTRLEDTLFYGDESLEEVRLPQTVDRIGYQAFEGCISLKSVTVPTALAEIDGRAFMGCESLEEMHFPAGFTRIGFDAFTGCVNLTAVTVPDTLGKIEWNAFYGCENLAELSLPDHVEIDGGAFDDCPAIVHCSYDSDTAHEISRTWHDFYEEGDTCFGLRYVEIYDENWQVTHEELSLSAYSGSLKEIELPGYIRQLGQYVFHDNESLEELTLPEGMTCLGHGACSGCVNLRKVNLPASLTEIQGCVFYGCKNLEDIVLPDALTELYDNVFYGAESLREITVPAGITRLRRGTFENCLSLESVHLPDRLEAIEYGAFSGCESLKEIYLPDNIQNIDYYVFTTSETKVFCDYDSVTARSLSESAQEFCIEACPGYRFLYRTVGGEEDQEEFLVLSSYQTEGEEDLTLPDLVQIISGYLFYGDDSITSVYIPESVQTIENYAFHGSESLREVAVPPSVERIGYGAFKDCPNLTLILAEGSYAEQYAREQGISYEYGYVGRQSGRAEAKIATEDGQIVPDGFTVYWYSQETGRYIGSGSRLRNVQPGQYRCEVYLDELLCYQYEEPEPVLADVQESDQIIEIRLHPIGQIRLEILVTGKDEMPLADASVTLKQTFHGLYEKTSTFATGEDGKVSVPASRVDSLLSVTAASYYKTVYELPVSSFAGKDRLDVRTSLKELPSNKISLTLTKQDVTEDGTDGTITTLSDYSSFRFSAWNLTQEKEIPDITVQGSYLILPEGSTGAFDQVRLSVTDLNGQVSGNDVVITLDAQNCGSVSWNLLQNGIVRVNEIKGADETVVMVFDAEGRCIQNSVVTGAYSSTPMPEGTYTLVFIKKTGLLRNVETLQRLTEYGLAASEDYVLQTVNIQNGRRTVLDVITLPALDETKLYYTIKENTNVWINNSTAITGQYRVVRVRYEIDPKYSSSQETVQIDLPEGLVFVERSVTLDGRKAVNIVEGNRIIIPVNNRSATIRFHVLPSSTGTHQIHAALSFDSTSGSIVQPIGSVSLKTEAATIQVPGKTSKEQVTVTGKAMSNCEITVYDNGVNVGQITSNMNGSWSLTFNLADPRYYSTHIIHAAIRNTEYGVDIETKPARILYNRTYVDVSKVTMINTPFGGRETETVFDFLNPSHSVPTYDYYGGYPRFTFKVEFIGEGVEALSNVKVVTTDSSGNQTFVPCSYDEIGKIWVGTHDYKDFADVPGKINVQFDHSNDVTYEILTNPQDYVEMMEEATAIESELTDNLSDTVTILNEKAVGEKVSYDYYVQDKKIGSYTLEARDYSEFRLEEWTDYLVYEDENGSLSYEMSLAEGNTYLKYTAIPEENLFVKESILLDESADKEIAFVALSYMDPVQAKAHWSEIALGGWDFLKGVGEVLTGIDDLKEIHGFLKDVNNNDSVLKDILSTIYNELKSKRYCKCFNANAYLSELLRYQVNIDTYKSSAMWRFTACMAVNGLINFGTARLGGLIKKGIFKGTKKLYRYVQKKSGHSGKGRLKTAVKNGMEFISDETSGMITDAIGGWGKDLMSLLDLETLREEINEEFNGYLTELSNLIKEIRNWKCPCEITQGKCECEKKPLDIPENPYEPETRNELPVIPKADPSGYVYEAVPSNRVSGVKAEIYSYEYAKDEYGVPEETKSERLWDAENYDQINPQITDENGFFGWDVPEGQWVVKFSKEGYLDADSYQDPAVDDEGYLPVPPIQTDVNTAIVSQASPDVKAVSAYPNEVDLDFSQYMQMDTVNLTNVVIKSGGKVVKGELVPVNAEYDYHETVQYASSFAFKPKAPLSGTVTVSISNVRNYCGTKMTSKYEGTAAVQVMPESITISGDKEIIFHENGQLQIQILPKEAGAGKQIQVTAYTPSIADVEAETVTADQNGAAVVKVQGKLPGQGVILVELEGTKLSETVVISVEQPSEPEPVPETIVLKKPAAPAVALASAGVKLTWKKPADAKKFKVFRKLGSKTVALGTTTKTTFTDTGVKSGKTYIYYVQALGYKTDSVIYKASAKSKGTKVTYRQLAKMAAPSVTNLAAGTVISWKKVTGASKYKVYRETKGKLSVLTTTTKLKFTDKTVKNGTAYKYFVQAIGGKAGAVIYQTGVKSAGTADTFLAVPSRLTVKSPKTKTAVVTWAKNTAAGGYQLRYSLKSNMSGAVSLTIKKGATAKATVGKLAKGKVYYFQIRAFKKVGSKTCYSAWSGNKKVKIS
ncbi:MAG: leucine-rich repeat protein [Blautia sp.]|nr:leucine-rich repeat protein [Blautia sp.]